MRRILALTCVAAVLLGMAACNVTTGSGTNSTASADSTVWNPSDHAESSANPLPDNSTPETVSAPSASDASVVSEPSEVSRPSETASSEPAASDGSEPSEQQKDLRWVLVDTKYELTKDVDDDGHKYQYSYEGMVDGALRMKMNGGFYDGDNSGHVCRYYECTPPPETFARDALLSVDLRLFTKEYTCPKGDMVWCPGTSFHLKMWDKYFFTDQNGETELYPGKDNNKPYVHGNVDLRKTVSLQLPPEGRSIDECWEGFGISLRWDFGGGYYEWFYELKDLNQQ